MTPVHPSFKGRHVRFCLRNVHLPDPAAVLRQLHGDDVLEGEVIEITDSAAGGTFFVVRVDGMTQPAIVSAEHIRLQPCRRQEHKAHDER